MRKLASTAFYYSSVLFGLDSIFNLSTCSSPLPQLLHSVILHFYLSLYVHGFLFIILPKNLWAIYYLNFACLKNAIFFILKETFGLVASFAPRTYLQCTTGFQFWMLRCSWLQGFLSCVGAFAAFIPSLFLKFLYYYSLFFSWGRISPFIL